MATVSIPCPSCGTGSILIEPNSLLSGVEFSCSSCQASISLNKNSEKTLKNGIEVFEKIKSSSGL